MSFHLSKDLSLNRPNPNYIITSLCFGRKYAPIFEHWLKNTIEKCPTADIFVPPTPSSLPFVPTEAWWDVIRLENNIGLLQKSIPIMHCDLDVIVVKDLKPIVEWGSSQKIDILFSKETWGEPLPICSGLCILYPSSRNFCEKLLTMMKQKKYGTYSDQNTLRSYILEQPHKIRSIVSTIDGITYSHSLIHVDNIKIVILDMELITRDPITTKTQFANHVNVDNVGGVQTFIRFFYERIEDLPLTCRCGKRHLGNTEICTHIRRVR